MAQTETIDTPQDYVNYTFNVQARGITELSSELAGLSNTASNLLGLLAFKTSEFLTHAESLAMGAGVAISALFASATESAIEFEQQIANVQAIGGEAVNAGAIGAAAMEYSNKFGMATSSMTEGLESLARAGITTTDVMKGVLEEGVKLSKLEGMDLEDSINDLISTTNLLSADDVNMNSPEYAQMVKDMNQHIVSTSESAPIDAQNIIQSLQHVGGYASASGIDQDDLFAVIAQLGSRGTKGEMAGTALRAFVSAGQKDTAQRALARIGLNVEDLWDKNGETMLPISEMKDVLDKALEKRGYSQQEKLEFYSDFAGYKQANQIMKIDTSEVQQYKESIANAWDLGKKLDTILGTVRGNLDRISQIMHNFMTKVGNQSLKILNIILTPLRMMLELITKIPFIDKFASLGMFFVAFRTGLMIFNRLTPAILGFLSGMDKIKERTLSLKGTWEGTVKSIEKAKDIIIAIKNQDQSKLTQIHYETHGLSAKNRANAEEIVASQMYLGSEYYKKYGLKWEDLDISARDMIIERYKATDEFKQNYNKYVELTKTNVDEIISDPIIIEDFSGTDNLEAINKWVKKIFNLLSRDDDKEDDNGRAKNGNNNSSGGQNDSGGDGGNGRRSGNSNSSGGQNDSGGGGSRNKNRDNDSGSQNDDFSNIGPERRRSIEDIIPKIMNGYNINPELYGNYEFAYRDPNTGLEQLKKDTERAYKDLRRKLIRFSNTDFHAATNEQRNVYRKLLYREAMLPKGKEYSARSNESEVRLALEKGRFEDENIEWYQGIKDDQIRVMGEILNVDMSDFHETTSSNDQRAEYVSKIHEALENKLDKEKEENREGVKRGLIDIITLKTNKIWEEQVTNKSELTVDPANILKNNQLLSKQIANALNINSDNSDVLANDSENYAGAVHSFFQDKSNREDDEKVNKATEIIFNHLKNNKKFSLPEEREIRYTIENLQRLRNTFEYLYDNNMDEQLKSELETIIISMDNYNEIFKKGGQDLGNAIADGFIIEGLGIHSPGFMYWGYISEKENIKKAISQSKDELGKTSSELGSEISKSFNNKLNFEYTNKSSGRIIDGENAKKVDSVILDKTFEYNKLNNANNNSTFNLINNEKEQLYDDSIYNYILFDTLKNIKEKTNKRTISPEKLFDIIGTEHENINGIEKFFNNNYKSNSNIFYRNGKIKITKLMNALSTEKELDKKYLSSDSKITSQEWDMAHNFVNANNFSQNRQTANLNSINNIILSTLRNIKRKNKRVVSQEGLFDLIRSEHGEHKANEVEKFFNDNYKSDSLVIKENGKIRINNLIRDLENKKEKNLPYAKMGVGALKTRQDAESDKYSYIKNQNITPSKQTTLETYFDENSKKAVEKKKQSLKTMSNIKTEERSNATNNAELIKHSATQGSFVSNLPPEQKTSDSSDPEQIKKDVEVGKYSHIMGVSVGVLRTRFDKMRDMVKKHGGGKRSISFINSLEKTHNKAKSGRDSAINSFVKMSKNIKMEGGVDNVNKKYIKNIADTKDNIEKATKGMEKFHDDLSKIANDFSLLTPIVYGTEIAIKALEKATTSLEMVENILSGSTKIFDKLIDYEIINDGGARNLLGHRAVRKQARAVARVPKTQSST